MFVAVPKRYDLVNRAITLGLDLRWRREASRACLKDSPRRVLDLCCGTGDLAAELSRYAPRETAVIGLDFSRPMLRLAQRKVEALARPVTFVQGDASAMPFPDGCFDGIGISFAFRNLTFRNPLSSRYLAEIRRVLAPGGRLVIVESSRPRSRFVQAAWKTYLNLFVAGVGSMLSGNRSAYHYLAQSAARFYTPEEIHDLLRGSGFQKVTTRRRLFGAVAIHIAS